MSQLARFLEIRAETLRNWPNIDTNSGRVRTHMWRMARQFEMDDRKRRRKSIQRLKNFMGFLRDFGGKEIESPRTFVELSA